MKAFEGCKNLVYLELMPKSNLKFIHRNVFNGINLKEIVIPFRFLNIHTYMTNYNEVTKIGIIDEDIIIDECTFIGLPNLSCVSFPYAGKITVESYCGNITFLIGLDVKLIGDTNNLKLREIDDELLKINKFPSEKEELQFYHNRKTLKKVDEME